MEVVEPVRYLGRYREMPSMTPGEFEMTNPQRAKGSSRRGLTVQELPRDERCAAAARQFVLAQLGPEIGEAELNGALLVVSELATNAYRHGRGRIEVRLLRRDCSVRIEVVDDGPAGQVHVRDAPGDLTGGWGLRVVEELALDWGAAGTTTQVWAELPL